MRPEVEARKHSFRTPGDPLRVLVFVALAVSAGGMIVRDQVNFSSDQAVSALMALEIRDQGVHPVFYWGVQYAGSFEPHLLSLVFRLLPATVLTYRLAMLFLLGSAVGLVMAATDRAFGRTASLLAGAYLALGPSFLFYKTLASDGAYASFLATLAAALFLATWLAAEPPARTVHAALFLLGASLGVAWWIMPLSVVFAPLIVVPVFREPRRWLRPSRVGAFLFGFLGGGLPWWVENLKTEFASLRIGELAPVKSGGFLEQFAVLIKRGLPVLLGGRSPGGRIPTFPGSEAISVGLFVLLLVVAVSLVRGDARPARRFLAGACLVLAVLPAGLALAVARTSFREDPRYLIATYLGLAPLLGVTLERLWKQGRTLATALLAGLLILLGPLSQLTTESYRNDPRHGRIPEVVEAAKELEAAGIQEVYAGYWTAYRLSFLSGGRVTGSPFGEGAAGPARSASALRVVDESPRPGFLLDDDPARRLKAYLDSRSVGYQSRFIKAFELELVSGIPAEELSVLRSCRCLSPPVSSDPRQSLPTRAAR